MKTAFRRFQLLLVLFVCGAVAVVVIELQAPVIDVRFHDVVATVVSESSDPARYSDYATLVKIDEESLAKLGTSADSRVREYLPAMLDTLRQAGAVIVVFDLAFVEEEPDLDPAFSKALRRFPLAIAGTDTGSVAELNKELVTAFDAIGDIRVRSPRGIPRYLDISAGRSDDDSHVQRLSLIAAELHSEASGIPTAGTLIPYLTGGRRDTVRFQIPFTRSTGYFPSFSLVDVLESDGKRIADVRRTPLSIFRGKAVFVGYDLPDEDRYELPNTFGDEVPGVYGHLNAFEGILLGRRIHGFSDFARIVISLSALACACAVFTITFKRIRRILFFGLPALWSAAVILLSGVFLVHVPLLSVLCSGAAAWAALRVTQRIQLKTHLKAAVGFDPEILESYRKQMSTSQGRVTRDTAVLCADIRDYTTFVKNNEIDTVTSVLAEYMAEMDAVIVRHGGYVNKFVGDEIVAVFGFPLEESDMCARAVNASLDMLSSLSVLISKWERAGVPHVNAIGIGLDVGEAAFLEVGGGTKRQFDIIGNPINGASRLQSLTKKVKFPLVASGDLIEELRSSASADSPAGRFELVGTVPIRGQGERMIFGYRGSVL